MAITGKVYAKTEAELADVVVTETDDYKIIDVKVNGQLAVRFPLALSVDTNEIALRTTNVVNQTGLVDNPVRVEVVET